MNNLEQEMQLQIHPRPKETVSIEIPKDTLESLQKIADSRDMSLAALLKLYIGQGLREDLARSFSNRVLEITEQVLWRHIQSEEEISNIIQEIQAETTSPPGVKTPG